jgi:O-methyltransferase
MSFVKRLQDSRWSWFAQGLPSPARAHALFRVRRATMTTPVRCRALWDQCHDLFRRRVPGALVECGVWRGGSAGVMALAARHGGERRVLHLFDSFEGLPEPQLIDEAAAHDYSGGRSSGELRSIDRCKAGREEVERFLFGQLALDRAHVHFHQGWFQNTVPVDAAHIGPIALLRLDGDWYESTQVCLDHLYPLLSPGGIVILDDYFAWAGCRKATDEYRARHGITTKLARIDVDAGCWIKV